MNSGFSADKGGEEARRRKKIWENSNDMPGILVDVSTEAGGLTHFHRVPLG